MITNDTANICLLFISHFYLQFKSSWLWGAERPVSLNKTDFKAHTIYMYIYMTFRSFIMSSPILPTSLIETSYQYLAAWKKTSAGASRHHPSLYFGLQLFLQLLRLTKHQLTGKVGWSLNCLPVSTHRKTSVEPKNWWVCWCFSFSKRRIFSASMLVFGTTVTNNLIPTRTADMNFGTCLYRIEPFLIPSGESWIAHNPWEARNQLRQPQPTRHFGVENVESCCQSSGNFSISGTIRRLTAPGLADGGTCLPPRCSTHQTRFLFETTTFSLLVINMETIWSSWVYELNCQHPWLSGWASLATLWRRAGKSLAEEDAALGKGGFLVVHVNMVKTLEQKQTQSITIVYIIYVQ